MAAVISFQPSPAPAATPTAALHQTRPPPAPAHPPLFRHRPSTSTSSLVASSSPLSSPAFVSVAAPASASIASSSASASASASSSSTPPAAGLPFSSQSVLAASGPPRDGWSCDACLRRRSRCAMSEFANKCYSCDFHRQDCTFTDAHSRKRKLDKSGETEPFKRQSKDSLHSPVCRDGEMSRARSTSPSAAIPSRSAPPGQHIGWTTELEPVLLEHLPLDHNDESLLTAVRVRRLGDGGPFTWLAPKSSQTNPQPISFDAIETLVAPYGSTLVDQFFQHIHPVFPILDENTFRQSYHTRRELSPLLLAAVYLLALKFLEVGPRSQTVRTPDATHLEMTAIKLLTEGLPTAQMSTVQAGLLLMQKSTVNTAALNAQLVTAGFELGLHLDCSSWRITAVERSLRKRLAWALYMQDKWASLVHGRPSHISAANWTVRDLAPEDFSAFKREEGTEMIHGAQIFCHQIALAAILSDVLDNFYTLKATNLFRAAGNNKTRLILEKAKPVQIRLKELFARLPPQLKMDAVGDLECSTADMAGNGAFHLAYFATEITLHRSIIRSLRSEAADPYLSHICRSAAKTRLISAMDFVNRLRPAHLKAFWPAASRTSFALVGSFGILLQVTAPTAEEAEFYRLRLGEYRWTLSMSVKHAEFLHSAIECLDLAMDLSQHVPGKPGIEELMADVNRPARHSRPVSGALLMRPDTMRRGPSSIMSGLASPATSISSDDSGLDA